jgi:tetratricopeptide (TPR) repeat protein
MYRSAWFLTAALVGTSVAVVQPAAVALSATEVQAIAKAVTVEINLQEDSSVGSGVIIARQGDLYTLVTNRHVVCGKKSRNKVPTGESYDLGLADGQHYRVTAASVKLLGTDLDLAIIQFRSQRNYAVAKVAASDSLKVNAKIYVTGFPFEQPGFSFNEGGTIAVVNKRVTGDNGGYTIIYDAPTLPGMSGGGVFDPNGRLVAIHGVGDRFKENTDTYNKSTINSKMGLNRGIPIHWLVQNLAKVDINLESDNSIFSRAAQQQVQDSADEHFILGFFKQVEPGNNVVIGKRQAIQSYSKAIELNPRYAVAYFMRAILYEQLQEFQRSLSDYNQAISINPEAFLAYHNRAILKYENLNDYQGGLNDFNQAIYLNPKYAEAYYNRALLKHIKLNDIQGALKDYNQAISINPKAFLAYNNRAFLKIANLNDVQGSLNDWNQAISLNSQYAEAYMGRALLKIANLKDRTGAIQDFRKAERLFREQGNTKSLQLVTEALKQLGVTE